MRASMIFAAIGLMDTPREAAHVAFAAPHNHRRSASLSQRRDGLLHGVRQRRDALHPEHLCLADEHRLPTDARRHATPGQAVEMACLCARSSWRDPTGESPVRVGRSGRPVTSVAWSPATAAAKRTQ